MNSLANSVNTGKGGAVQTAAHAPKQSVTRVAGASLAGTTLEYYDHFIYGAAAALVFPKIFFPQSDPLVSSLLSLASYGVAFVARPLGAALFGHYGDKHGRKSVLFLTLLVMGLATFLIGLLPSYGSIGVAAPILLVILRIIQGLALGGEWGGAASMVNELDPEGNRRGFLGAVVQLASPIGLLLANGVFALVTWQVSETAFLEWAWRIPFLASVLLVGVGLYIRMNLKESTLFEKVEQAHAESRAPVVEVFRNYKRELAIAFGVRLGGDVAFYVFSVFLLYFLPTHFGMSKNLALTCVLLGAIGQIVVIPLSGWLSDRIGRRPLLIFSGVGGTIWAFIYFMLLETRDPTLIVLASFVGMVFAGFMFSPLASFMPELFPTRVRVTGASLGFQLPVMLGGALAPVITAWMLAKFSSTTPLAIYLASVCALIAIAAWCARETMHVDLRKEDRR